MGNESSSARTDPLDTLPFDIIHVDRAARIRYVNHAATRTLTRLEAFLPIPATQILGQPIEVLDRLPELVDLTISPMLDERGRYIGIVLTTPHTVCGVSATIQTDQPSGSTQPG